MFNSSVSVFFFSSFFLSFFFSCEEDFVLCKNEAIVLNVPKVSMGHKHVIVSSYLHVQWQTALDDLWPSPWNDLRGWLGVNYQITATFGAWNIFFAQSLNALGYGWAADYTLFSATATARGRLVQQNRIHLLHTLFAARATLDWHAIRSEHGTVWGTAWNV